MAKKYCNNCTLILNSEVRFCPECGGAVKKYKENRQLSNILSVNKKNFFIIGAILILLIIIAIVVFAIFENIHLKNNAQNSKSNVFNKGHVELISENLGNLPCNICAQAYTVNDGTNIYFAGNDGIYKSNFNSKEINKEDSKKIADGKFSSLNYYDGNIFCIKSDDNSIYRISDISNEDKNPYVDKIYNSDPGFILSCFAINSDNIYVLSENSGKFYLTSTNMRSKNKINDVWNGEGTKAWMFLNESTFRLCVLNAGEWNAYKGDIDGNKTSGLTKYCSGSSNPVSVAFLEDKVYTLGSSSSNFSTITINEAGGNRNDITLDCKAKKLLLSGETVFVECDSEHFLWFNTDTNMSHDINNSSFKNEEVKTININNWKFCVLYNDGSMVFNDLSSLN